MASGGPSPAQIQAQLRNMEEDQRAIGSKIAELEIELNEHNLVINAIEPLDPKRKCFRLVGGVLVERTVEEVLPAVKKNKQAIEDIIKQLQNEYRQKSKEIQDFMTQHNIQFRREGAAESAPRAASTGVLA